MDLSGSLAVEKNDALYFHTIGGEGDEFPCFKPLWEMYSAKGIRTVFVTVGASKSCLADLTIAEALGCPVHYVALSEKEEKQWNEVSAIAKERIRSEQNSTYPFSIGSEKLWVLSKHIRQISLPWWMNGTLDISGYTVKTENIIHLMEGISQTLKIKNNEVRMDILKIDTTNSAPEMEYSVLSAIMTIGFRPGCILVNWTKRPDESVPCCIAAGTLQSLGYDLVRTKGNKFLYYYTGNDLFSVCSWEGVRNGNPIVTELTRAVKEAILSKKEDTLPKGECKESITSGKEDDN